MRSGRLEFPKSVKLAAWDRCKGRCECGCGMKIIKPEYDHYPVAASLGGSNELSNCRVLDVKCHRLITAKKDVPALSKSERIYEKRAGIRKPKGRPLAGTKASGWKKPFYSPGEKR